MTVTSLVTKIEEERRYGMQMLDRLCLMIDADVEALKVLRNEIDTKIAAIINNQLARKDEIIKELQGRDKALQELLG